jgi:hypothetical protein
MQYLKRLVILLLLFATCLINAQITAISSMPGFPDQRQCVRCSLGECGTNIYGNLGCNTGVCICQHFGDAMSMVQVLALTSCSSAPADVAAATSILNAFCAQISISSASLTTTAVPYAGGYDTVTTTVWSYSYYYYTTSLYYTVTTTETISTTSTAIPQCTPPSPLFSHFCPFIAFAC